MLNTVKTIFLLALVFLSSFTLGDNSAISSLIRNQFVVQQSSRLSNVLVQSDSGGTVFLTDFASRVDADLAVDTTMAIQDVGGVNSDITLKD